MTFQIVLAWTENLEGKAVMWIRKGSDQDLEKARTHAAAENRMVFTFPTTERNPLERAKQMVLSA